MPLDAITDLLCNVVCRHHLVAVRKGHEFVSSPPFSEAAFYRVADRMLYEAKAAGRNAVRAAQVDAP